MKRRVIKSIKTYYQSVIIIGLIILAFAIFAAFVDHQTHFNDPRSSDQLLKTGVLAKAEHVLGKWDQSECWDLTFEDGAAATVYFNNVFQIGESYGIFKTQAGTLYACRSGQSNETIGP